VPAALLGALVGSTFVLAAQSLDFIESIFAARLLPIELQTNARLSEAMHQNTDLGSLFASGS
jgi:hypothetical protein